MNTKKILLIIAFVVLVVAFAALIYFVFLKDIVSPPKNENVNAAVNVNAGLPNINAAANVNITNAAANVNKPANANLPANANQAGLTNIASGGPTAAYPVVSQSEAAQNAVTGDGIRYYDKETGKFYRRDANGQVVPLSDQTFPKAEKISWSPVNDKAVIVFPDQSKIMYDFDKQEQATLPKEWDNIEFSPAGDKLGFKNIGESEDSRWLAVANPNGTSVELIEPVGDKTNDVAVNWSPAGQVMALYREAYSGDSQEIYLIGLHGENFKSLVTNGRGFEGLWSPKGDQLLYSVYNDGTRYNPTLFLVDAEGDQIGANEMKVGLQTWASKCAFSRQEAYVYCAVPQFLETGSGLNPDLTANTNDGIYKININTGTKSLIAKPTFSSGNKNYTIDSMFVSNNDSTLYFTEKQTEKLYSLKLK